MNPAPTLPSPLRTGAPSLSASSPQVRARTEKLDSPSWTLISVTVLAWAVRLAAGINFLAFTLHHAPRIIYWLGDWVPFEISVGRRLLMLLTAVLLFLLASGLERGKRIAWLLTLVALSAAPFIHFGRMLIWPQVLFNFPLIILLIVNRRFFVARSDRKSLYSALIISPVLMLLLLVGGTVRLHQLRFETSGPDSWSGCLQAACELILVQNTHTQEAQTLQAIHFFSVLRISGTSIALLTVFLSMRPVLLTSKPTREQSAAARRLVDEYSDDPVHAYALLPDKNLFFTRSQGAVIPFVVARRFAVALADPIGPLEERKRAVVEFIAFCRHHDWVPLFYQTSSDLLDWYERQNFHLVKIGEDAQLDVTGFDLKGRDFQNLRTLCNHARKQGITFRWYDPAVEVDENLEKQLAAISEQWLQTKRGTEMTFNMGSFSREDIGRFGAGVALDASGRALAFSTWRPFAQSTGRVLDLMRSAPSARNVLDFALVESIFHFKALGIAQISLGTAPLANVDPAEASSMESRLVRFVYENLTHVYSYKPLFEFKRKYRPQWFGRYLAYPNGESLPLVGVALVKAHAPQGSWKFLTAREQNRAA